ncbi:MAG: Na/Pi cotransporter family protein [Oscillospiraceae bacterium]|nr:Na/Pi cotransporter family protein [Oscillospiraceae bacterium]
MDIFDVLNMIGGLALFLFGMNTLSGALEKLAGGKLEKWLEKLTSHPVKGVLLGAAVTAVIQSSSATTVMMVGFVNSGIMKLRQAIGVIMGANIGTTMTSWLLSLTALEGDNIIVQLLKPSSFTPILAIIGTGLVMFSKSDKKHNIATILLGFAVLMFGMDTMSDAVSGLKDVPAFGELMIMFSNPILGVIAGAVLTAVIQSSSASVGILQALATSTGKITHGTALPILLGQNIGTCVTALISSIGANKSAKRVAIVHLLFNVLGTVVFLSLFYLLNAFISFPFMELPLEGTSIPIIHTAFNLLATLLFLPFTKQIEKLAELIIRDDPNAEEDDSKIPILDERFLKTPSVAIEQCRNVAIKMAKLTRKTINQSLDVLTSYDQKLSADVVENENAIDIYEDKIGSYLLKISSKDLSEHDSRVVSKLLHTIGDLERISDHAVNVVEAAEEMYQKKIKFSDDALAEIEVIKHAVTDILDKTIEAFVNNDVLLAKQVEPLEDVIDHLRTDLKSRHIERLREGRCTIELGFILSDLLTNLERVSDHCSNIAVCMIQVKENNMDTHEYMTELKRDSESAFMEKFNEYKTKYVLPVSDTKA